MSEICPLLFWYHVFLIEWNLREVTRRLHIVNEGWMYLWCNLVFFKTLCKTFICWFVFVFFFIESNVKNNCTERRLTLCEDQFNENTLPVCPEVVELQVCLAACVNNKEWPSQVVRLKYEILVKKMNSYPDCIPTSKGMTPIYWSVLYYNRQL